MPKDFQRVDRIREQIKRELAVLIPKEVKDPRLTGMISISEVRVTRDLGHAKVYFTILGGNPDIDAAVILNHAAAYLRNCLGAVMRLRTIPHLYFVYDVSLIAGNKLASLIDEAVQQDNTRKKTTPGDDKDAL